MVSCGTRVGIFYHRNSVESFNKMMDYFDMLYTSTKDNVASLKRSKSFGTIITFKNGDIVEMVGISDNFDNMRGRRYDKVIIDKENISQEEYETIVKPRLIVNEIFI